MTAGQDEPATGRAGPAAPWRIAVDVGGTFTDIVLADANGSIFIFKSLSRPDDATGGVLAALERAAESLGRGVGALLSGCALFVHGSTVATNTILELSGATVGLLTTEGFRDSLEIRRGVRKNPWDHRTPYPPVLVPRYRRLPVTERIDRHGNVHTPVDEASVMAAMEAFAAEGVDSVAICLLNSFLNPVHEQIVADLVRAAAPGVSVSVSSEIVPIAGEYDRLSTTVVDAYVGPRLVSYLRALDARLQALGLARPMLLVKNNGGTAGISEVVREPVVLTLSGPAAAVGALHSFSGPLDGANMISLEVGGTSCDVVVMTDGKVAVSDRLSIGEYDTVVPSVEVHTVGAGGGAIAGVDSAGVLFVGPRGAGADPGPAGYGRGGTEPTVTDAQLVLGRLGSGLYAGGALSLDASLAETAVRTRIAEPLGVGVVEAAAGIIRVTEQRMLHAVSYISVHRGLDPRGYTLVAGGGAGGLHGASVARQLGCPAVYVPRRAGVLCALGMLYSDVRHDHIRAYGRPLDDADPAACGALFDSMSSEARAGLEREGFAREQTYFERAIDLRYQSQQWDVRVPLAADGAIDRDAIRADFEDQYERLYGHRQPETRIEIVKFRLTGFGVLPAPGEAPFETAASDPAPVAVRSVYVDEASTMCEVAIYSGGDLKAGHRLRGPLVVEEETTTVLVGRDDRLEVDAAGNYLIRLAAAEGERHDA